MTRITNTLKNPKHEWLGGGNPNAIRDQEKQGQKELVGSDLLPTKGSETIDFIEWGEVCKDDPIFRKAKLPEGWTKIATDHDMWSMIKDSYGVERASIFYKAAFYDRSAEIYLIEIEENNGKA